MGWREYFAMFWPSPTSSNSPRLPHNIFLGSTTGHGRAKLLARSKRLLRLCGLGPFGLRRMQRVHTHGAATRGRGRVSSDATGEQQPRGSRVPSAVRFGLAVRGGDRGAVRARRDVYPCGFDRDSSLPAPGIIYPRRSTCRSRGYHRNRMARSPLRSVPRSRR